MGFDSFKFADVILPPIHVHHFPAAGWQWTVEGAGRVDPYIHRASFCDQYELPSHLFLLISQTCCCCLL